MHLLTLYFLVILIIASLLSLHLSSCIYKILFLFMLPIDSTFSSSYLLPLFFLFISSYSLSTFSSSLFFPFFFLFMACLLFILFIASPFFFFLFYLLPLFFPFMFLIAYQLSLHISFSPSLLSSNCFSSFSSPF